MNHYGGSLEKLLTIFPQIVSAETILLSICKILKIYIVSTLVFLLCNENKNSFLTRVREIFKGGN